MREQGSSPKLKPRQRLHQGWNISGRRGRLRIAIPERRELDQDGSDRMSVAGEGHARFFKRAEGVFGRSLAPVRDFVALFPAK
jgi:hypothetical protein